MSVIGRAITQPLLAWQYADILLADNEATAIVPHYDSMPYDVHNQPKPGDIFILTRQAWKDKRLFSEQTRPQGEDGVGQVLGSKRPRQAWNENNRELYLTEIPGEAGERYILQKSFIGQRDPPEEKSTEQKHKKVKHGVMVRHEVTLVTKEYATENRDKTIKDRAALPAKVICHYLDPPEGGNDKQFKLSEPDPRLRLMLPVVLEVRDVVGSVPPPTQTSSGDDEQDETPGEAGPSSLGQRCERGTRASGRRSLQEPSELPPEGRLESAFGVDDVEAWISCVVTDGELTTQRALEEQLGVGDGVLP